MNIQLRKWKVAKLDLQLYNQEDNTEEANRSFKFSYKTAGLPRSKNSFVVSFEVSIIGQDFKMDLLMDFFFVTDNDLNDKFFSSPFAKVNAPAIAFPYIRSYISNLTMQSGYETVVLPSINFVKLTEDK
ncbi:protein-export chaperone SecB [Porphyromonas somerae]|uniref:protein-export chaperone SecB n=1 Tax=Porphyromonas somerae TaxID=322095 RepID=UPI001FCBC46D|nr:protein-export chaperone SecB [Porphyromonas somerae]BDE81965.1 hypothetical protein CE91St14_09930 [Porphyromonas somerae]